MTFDTLTELPKTRTVAPKRQLPMIVASPKCRLPVVELLGSGGAVEPRSVDLHEKLTRDLH
jgi:hypothetical protein